MALGLVLDLSFAGFVAVVDEEDNPLCQDWRPPGVRHDDVSDWVGSCLNKAGGNFSDLGWIAVGVGPGSFTGIRIAMAFAQGLALPRNLPLYGFNSFDALLLSCQGMAGETTIAVLPANSGRFYVAIGMDDPGAMVDEKGSFERVDSETVLVIPARVPSLETLIPKFNQVVAIEGRWNVPGLVKQAKGKGRDPYRPYYLQLSAAEEKAGTAAQSSSISNPS